MSSRGSAVGWGLALFGLLLGAPGCSGPPPLTAAGLGTLTLPAGWTAADPSAFVVPGEPLAAWRGPEGASLVIFRDLWIPAPRPEALAIELAGRYRNLPGVTVASESVERLGGPEGPEVARVEVTGPGTGDTWVALGTDAGRLVAPPGRTLVPTRRIALGWPRADSTTWMYWHCPESGRDQLAQALDATLRSLAPAAR